MILLIWSIYVIFAGKYQLAKHYGVTGGAARLCGLFNLLVSLGMVGAVIPIREPLINIGVQFFLIVMVGLLAVAIHGNDFKKPTDSEAKPIEGPPKYCPHCGEKNEKKAKTCVNCGMQLPTLSAAPTIPELRKKYNITFEEGKYCWNGSSFESFDAALVEARKA